jgi:hypothetical protein
VSIITTFYSKRPVRFAPSSNILPVHITLNPCDYCSNTPMLAVTTPK